MTDGESKALRLSAVAGGAGGSWYVLLEGLARLVGDLHPDLAIQVIEGGGVQNHHRVGTGEVPMGILNPPMTVAALAGSTPFDRPYPDLRCGVANLTMNHLQFVVAQDVPLTSFQDWLLKRWPLRLPVDRVGTVDRMVFDLALDHYGASQEDLAEFGGAAVPAMNYDEQLALYSQGKVDGFWQFMAIPNPSIEAAHAVRPVKALPLDGDLISKLTGLGWDAGEIPTGSYGVTKRPIATVSMGTTLGFHAGVTDDVAFAVTSAICERPERVSQIHPGARGFDPRRAHLGCGGPLHPGAARFYRSSGLAP